MLKKNLLKVVGVLCVSSMLFMTACDKGNNNSNDADAQADTSQNEDTKGDCDVYEAMSYAGYKLEKVVVLSRHNIRSPLSGAGSVLGDITPHEWFNWSSNPSELSLKGGILETEMGQYFRKWFEREGLFEENFRPNTDQVRIYANSKERTIATAEYFTAGLLPTANMQVEYHEEFDKMDPVFNPQLTFANEAYAADATAQIYELFGDKMKGLSDNYDLIADVIDMKDADAYKKGDIGDFDADDTQFKLEEGAEPTLSGSLKTGCSVSDALVLQYYEEKDDEKAAFGHSLETKDWEDIAEIKDVYGDVLFTAPLISANVAHPLLQEINKEMNTEGRLFTFLCGHDSNLASVLAALNVKDYSLPNAIEKKTPIGSKLVFSRWSDENGGKFWSVDLIYQNVNQLRNIEMLDADCGPCIYHMEFEGLQANDVGLYADADLNARFSEAIADYDEIVNYYANIESPAA